VLYTHHAKLNGSGVVAKKGICDFGRMRVSGEVMSTHICGIGLADLADEYMLCLEVKGRYERAESMLNEVHSWL